MPDRWHKAQDRSPFCILHIMNEISQRPDLMDTFLVRNHCHIFCEDYQIKCSQHYKKHEWILSKNIQKKWPQNGPLSCFDGSAFVFCPGDYPFKSVPTPTSADACGEVTGCAASHQEVSTFNTRGGS